MKSKFKTGDKINYNGNNGVVRSVKYVPTANDFWYYIGYVSATGVRKGQHVRENKLNLI